MSALDALLGLAVLSLMVFVALGTVTLTVGDLP